jgi:hypothetical protein
MDEERVSESHSRRSEHGPPDGDDVQSDLPITNPDFSVAELNPAFTQASPPPPPPPPDEATTQAQGEMRIRELEQLLEDAAKRIERGAEALERSRKRR